MNIREEVDTLKSEIDRKCKEIRSDSYSMSIGEWISLYQQQEIELIGEFPKIFCWSDSQKNQLIESIFLGIPIPAIYVYQRKDGIWEVLDGLQRLSTIYQFVGILKDKDGRQIPPLTLQPTEYLPSLAGKIWKDKEYPQGSIKGLTPDQRFLIKKANINVNIVLEGTNNQLKYDLFQRLNITGIHPTSEE
jgi:hypothetical protein